MTSIVEVYRCWPTKEDCNYIISRNNQRIFAGDPGAALWWQAKGELRVLACDKYRRLAELARWLGRIERGRRSPALLAARLVQLAAIAAERQQPAPHGLARRIVLGRAGANQTREDAVVKTSTRAAGRLALRVEGKWWQAYWARPDTMERAILLGSIRVRAAENPAVKDAFLALMQTVVSDLMHDVLGVAASWPTPPTPAPERERSGNA